MKKLEFHPLADLFPLMEGAEFEALVADIKANGLHEPIVLFRGKILDGRNRYRALERLGTDTDRREDFYFHKLDDIVSVGGDEVDYSERRVNKHAMAYVVSKNIHRRHLNVEQREKVFAMLIARNPEKSDRQIAKEIGVDHKTIGRARAKGEDVGSIPHVDRRTDTKGRKQPARKYARMSEHGPPPYDDDLVKNVIALVRENVKTKSAKEKFVAELRKLWPEQFKQEGE